MCLVGVQHLGLSSWLLNSFTFTCCFVEKLNTDEQQIKSISFALSVERVRNIVCAIHFKFNISEIAAPCEAADRFSVIHWCVADLDQASQAPVEYFILSDIKRTDLNNLNATDLAETSPSTVVMRKSSNVKCLMFRKEKKQKAQSSYIDREICSTIRCLDLKPSMPALPKY